MTAQQELSSNTRMHPSRTSGYPQLKTVTPSPAMWLYAIPTHTLQAASKLDSRSQNREMILSCWNAHLIEQYNHTVHTLCPLQKGTNSCNTTTEHIPMRHNRSGHRNPLQPPGRITLRNRKCLRKLEIPKIPLPIPSAVLESLMPNPRRYHKPYILVPQTMDTWITSSHPPSNITQPPTMTRAKTAWALSRLLPHNQPGLKELIPPQIHFPCVMREEEEM